MQVPSLESRIASLVHTHFDALPKRSKPTIRSNGTREWIPMSGIVLVLNENTPQEILKCVAVTTGAKCLFASQIPKCQGLLLHDSHAEVLALRAFNYWLIRECRTILAWEKQHQQRKVNNPSAGGSDMRSNVVENGQDDNSASPFVKRRPIASMGSMHTDTSTTWPPFELRNEVRVYMYCTCAPCGDASMELCMAAQDDPTPWKLPAGHIAANDGNKQSATGETVPRLPDGRAHFSVLGVVRRKPSRPDAEPTLSKSCSDKLALRQITSLLSFPASLLVSPTQNAYLAGLVLPEDEISRVGCKRSFGAGENGRLRPFSGRSWGNNNGLSYRYIPFTVRSVPTEEVDAQWSFSKKGSPSSKEDNTSTSSESKTTNPSKPGIVSAVWISGPSWSPTPLSSHALDTSSTGKSPKPSQVPTSTTDVNETLLNGVKQGYHLFSPSPRKASVLSRARMWELLRETILEFNLSSISEGTYRSQGAEKLPVEENEKASNPTKAASSTKTPLDHALTSITYEDLKRGFVDDKQEGFLREHLSQEAKDIMGNWIRNQGDESWGMEVLREIKRGQRGDST